MDLVNLVGVGESKLIDDTGERHRGIQHLV